MMKKNQLSVGNMCPATAKSKLATLHTVLLNYYTLHMYILTKPT